MSAGPTVFFYVQHLLGIGHVFRASRIARALSSAGARVVLAWGGTKLPSIDLHGLEMVWLEPVRASDAMITGLVRADGSPADEAMLEARKDDLLNAFHQAKPDILITEMFPFGRRQMRFELVPLMQAARSADWPLMTVSSVRDILPEGRKAKRIDETIEAVKSWFDLILVHGDPKLITIDETLPRAAEIAEKIRYTGIVAPPPVDFSVAPSIEADVVVSAGGGAVGHALTAATIGAAAHSTLHPANWLLIAGPERARADVEMLQAQAGEALRVVRFVPDLARIMASAKVSVSRAGYNTVGDILRAGCPRVVAPFEGGRETEQLRRASMLAERGAAVMVRDNDLSPQHLGAAVDEAARAGMAKNGMDAGLAFDLEGADNSAAILLSIWRERSGSF